MFFYLVLVAWKALVRNLGFEILLNALMTAKENKQEKLNPLQKSIASLRNKKGNKRSIPNYD